MEEIYEILSNRYGMSKMHIRIICESPFRFTVSSLRKKELKSFNYPGLGKIAIHQNKLKYINESTKEHSRRLHQLDLSRPGDRGDVSQQTEDMPEMP